jgi:hypothetical protein
MSRFRPVAFLAIAALVLALPACLGTRGPSLPDLSAEHSQVGQRSQRLLRIRRVMTDDLAEFETLRAQVSERESGLFARPFPLDLFKHVAIECLNQPWDPNQLQVDPSQADQPQADQPQTDQPSQSDGPELGLACSPEFGGRLLVELEEQVPARRDQALSMLEKIDKLRELRGKLRQRLSRIPSILQASQSLLATRRADLRQTRATFRRRRTEYSDDRWQQLQERLDAFESELSELEVQIKELEEVFPGWSPRLDRSVSMLYMELAQLYP